MSLKCQHCGTNKFVAETLRTCCNSGKVVLPGMRCNSGKIVLPLLIYDAFTDVPYFSHETTLVIQQVR